MPPEGQAPQQQSGQRFGELVQQTARNLIAMQNIMGKAGAPPEAVQLVEQANQSFVQAIEVITGGGQQQPPPPLTGNVDAMGGVTGRPM